MDITTFRDIVASFMLRSSSSLASSLGEDLIILAINNAKRFAQRRHNFEMSRVQASVSVAAAPTGGDLTSAVLFGTSTSVNIKLIERAYLQSSSNQQYYPIHIISRSYLANRLLKRIDLGTLDPEDQQSVDVTNSPYLIRSNNTLFIYPDPTATTTVVMDAVKWLPDYDTTTVTTDFLMEYAQDYLLYRSVVELNFFLKEDQRVVISQNKMDEVWQSVLAWDNSLIENTSEDAVLD